jgi:hypothetical protein
VGHLGKEGIGFAIPSHVGLSQIRRVIVVKAPTMSRPTYEVNCRGQSHLYRTLREAREAADAVGSHVWKIVNGTAELVK